ncbi:MAG: DUF481 domain-containing protein [Candidatus Cloacimonetes bacterium]|nr:DUF481 domain-containing protein [Candidatus Cloacimonadota bacterium]
MISYRWAILDLGSKKSVCLGYNLLCIPKIADKGDHRVFLLAYMQARLSEDTSIKFSLTQEYDSNSPIGVKKKDTQVTMSPVFSF